MGACRRLRAVHWEGAMTTRTFQTCTSSLFHLANILKIPPRGLGTPRPKNPGTLPCILFQHIMELKNAPESMTRGIDELLIKRADWVAKEHRSRADMFRGRGRPGDAVRASKTTEDMNQLASNTSRYADGRSTDEMDRADWTCQ